MMRVLLTVVITAVLAAVAVAGGCGDDADSRPAATATSTQRSSATTFVASDAASPQVVWAVGDAADGGPESRRVADLIAAGDADRLLYLGDVYDSGTADEFARNYDAVFGRFARITAPTPGNHDWDNRAEGYDAYWRRKTRRTPPQFYAFRLAGWTFLSLNSEADHDEDSAQVRWLRRTVRRPGTCRVAFWHRPRYSAGTHGDAEDVEPLWDALRGRARLVLNGHDHDLQRLRPRDGITELVSGAGGRGLYELDRDYRGLSFGNDRAHGALRLDVRPRAIRYRFVTADGATVDSGTVRCRGS